MEVCLSTRTAPFGQPGSGHDSASTTYTYDTAGRIRRRLRNDLNGHFAYDLELDDQGRVLHETYTRIDNLVLIVTT